MRHTSCAKLPRANTWSQLTQCHCENKKKRQSHRGVDKFPPDILAQAIPGMKLITIYAGPEDLGWPVRRPSVWNILLNPESVIWLGGSRPQLAFDSFFKRTCLVDGDILCQATDQERIEYLAKFVLLRGLHLDASKCPDPSKLDLRQLFRPAQARRLQEYRGVWSLVGQRLCFDVFAFCVSCACVVVAIAVGAWAAV